MVPTDIIVKIYSYIGENDKKYPFIEAFPQCKELIQEECNCGKRANYIVSCQWDDTCDDCDGEYEVNEEAFLCKPDCDNFMLYECKSKTNKLTGKFSVEYSVEKSDCHYCGKRVWCQPVDAAGIQLRKPDQVVSFPKKNKNKKKKNNINI